MENFKNIMMNARDHTEPRAYFMIPLIQIFRKGKICRKKCKFMMREN